MRQVSNSLRPVESMMACTVRVPSTRRKISSSWEPRRILLDAPAGGSMPSPPSGAISTIDCSTTGRNTMSKDGIFFSMMGHSSTIRIPSMRMKSALMGVKFSRS